MKGLLKILYVLILCIDVVNGGIRTISDKFSLYEDCYPFIETPKLLVTRSERISFNSERARHTTALTGSGHPCRDNGVCWCADTNDPDESRQAFPSW